MQVSPWTADTRLIKRISRLFGKIEFHYRIHKSELLPPTWAMRIHFTVSDPVRALSCICMLSHLFLGLSIRLSLQVFQENLV